ncbi:hypothetical protein AHAT_34210 [Agarivorans sp. Toyoura001]|uniref:PEP-CTERM sorting domain-containing protein n=1 Tax=Agarivorans sp. Toyoura001 TaxID=2283141 RepID=UPI0010DB87E6|nr:PEP-CTERM sorting domain-containing protein [Agarivorans sp. Toyoura001]GDY27531.1 hypothetical protein AHAT_34210 [Agarivorans sp. Toyoura001]
MLLIDKFEFIASGLIIDIAGVHFKKECRMLKTNTVLPAYLLLLSSPSFASVIAYDMLNSNSQGLIEHSNPYEQQFNSEQDGFEKYRVGVSATIPNSLLDTSLTIANDSLGIVDAQNDTDTFFGVTDVVNPNNSSGSAQAVWHFNIAGFTLNTISIATAAMGDFESSDIFSFAYSIDAAPVSALFSSVVDEQSDQNYRLANGNQQVLNDPLLINNQRLNNQFQTLEQSLNGSGSVFSLYFNAAQNSGAEAFAFRDIVISGNANLPAQVPEPTSIWLALLGLSALVVRKAVGEP